jgi:hypothetical protein
LTLQSWKIPVMAAGPASDRLAREVHRDIDVDTGIQPGLPLLQGAIEHPAGERHDEAGLLRGGDEPPRRDQTLLRVLPPHQRLHPNRPAEAQIDRGLEVEHQLVAGDGVPQLSGERRCGKLASWSAQTRPLRARTTYIARRRRIARRVPPGMGYSAMRCWR